MKRIMSGDKAVILMQYILHGSILLSFVCASPISLIPKQVGLSDDVQVLSVNGSQDCEYGGKIYENGDHFKDPLNPCETCQCSGGEITCSVRNCPPAPSDKCKEIKEEGKCCSSYICPAISEALDDQKRTESIPTDTTTVPTESETPQKTEISSFDQEQNAINSLFIHKVILESIKKEQEQEHLNEVQSNVTTVTELSTTSTEVSEPVETSTLSEYTEADKYETPTTLESISEKDTTEEFSVEENLIREASDVSTIRSDIITTFEPTEKSVQEKNETEKDLVTEDSYLNEEISTNSEALDQETTEISSSNGNTEYGSDGVATEKQLSEVSEESTPIYEIYNDRAGELFTAEPVADANEELVTENEESGTSDSKIENLIKAAESAITSQTEVYEEEYSTTEGSNSVETTKYNEERGDVSTSDYIYATELTEEATKLESLEPRLSDNHEASDQVSTISNNEISDELVGESLTVLATEIPLDINTVRNVDYVSPTEVSDGNLITTSNYESSNQEEEDTNLSYTFEGDKTAQATKAQKSESINIEDINKFLNEIEEEITSETETITLRNTDVTDSPYYEETKTTLDLVEKETSTAAIDEETEMENLFKSDLTENSISDFELSMDAASEHFTTEVYSTTVSSEDTETKATDTENDLDLNSARKESIAETTTESETLNEEDGFLLVEESTTLENEAKSLLEEDLISTTEKSEAEGDDLETTTEIPYVPQESNILTKTLSNNEETEEVGNKIELVAETKPENTSGKNNETATENEEKSQAKTLVGEKNIRRKPQNSNIHLFDKILSNGSVTRIETHSSENRKSPKNERISTQFHHLARKYGLRPLTRKISTDDVKNRRKYRKYTRKSLFEDKQ